MFSCAPDRFSTAGCGLLLVRWGLRWVGGGDDLAMRILALDVGGRRTGVAISDPMAIIARPLETIEHRSKKELCSTMAALVEEQGVE